MYTSEEVIVALYRAALGREPDPTGLADYSALLTLRRDALIDVAAGLLESAEHRSCLGYIPAILDHSQYGEFKILLRQAVGRAQRHGIVVDVGARGRDRSNSYDLLTNFGWRGLLIEANPALQDAIREEFTGTSFTLLNMAVGVEEGVLPFYIGANDDVSSLIEHNAGGWGPVRGKVHVEVSRLAPILQQHAIPFDLDLLSLDIEGLDVPVLNDLIDSSEYRPLTVIIEASDGFRTSSLADVGASALVQRHYQITAQTDANLVLEFRE